MGLAAALRRKALPEAQETDQSLDMLCRMAADVMGAHMSALVLRQGGRARVLGGFGLVDRPDRPRPTLARAARGFEEAMPRVDGSDDQIGGQIDESAQIAARYLGQERLGFFICERIAQTDDYALSLIVADANPLAEPTPLQRQLVRRLGDVMAEAVQGFAHLLADSGSHVAADVSLEEAIKEVEGADTPAALIDDKLMALAISRPLADLMRTTAEDLRGRPLQEIDMPMNEAVVAVCRHAAQTRAAPPEFEVLKSDDAGGFRAFSLNLLPFSPIDDPRCYVHVCVRETTQIQRETQCLDRELARSGEPPTPVEPSFAFLQETLVPRRAIRSRNKVNYLTLRSWRTSLRNWQIKALRALKGGPPEVVRQVADSIADEIVEEIEAMFGDLPGALVAPIPCGHSKGACLSVEIGRAVGAKLGLPVVHLFKSVPLKGTSHPKKNARRPPLTLLEAPRRPTLVIDDVATSGAHLEQAVKLLRPTAGMVFAVAWISGDAA